MFRSKKALSLIIVLVFANVAGAQEKQPAPVDQYGDPLPAGAMARIGTVRFRQTGPIASMVFSPDGKVLATAGWKFVCLWDVITGKELQRFPAGFCANAAFSPDGKLLAVVADNKKLCVWDIAKHQIVAELELRRIQNLSGGVPSIAFAESGEVLRFADVFGTLQAWDLRNGKELSLPDLPEKVQLGHHSAIAPGGKIVACEGLAGSTPDKRDPSITYSEMGPTYLFDLATGKKLHTLNGHKSFVRFLVFSGDGKILATAGYDEAPILWDVATGKLLRKLSFLGVVNPASLAFSPDGKTLAVGDRRSSLGLWDVATGKRISTFTTPFAGRCATFAPDGKTLAIADQSAVRFLDATSGKELRPQNEIVSGIDCAAWFPDGKSVALSMGEAIWKHDTSTGKAITMLRSNHPSDRANPLERVSALALAPDGKKIGFVHGRNVELLDLDTRKPIKCIELEDLHGAGAFTFACETVAYVSITPLVYGDEKPRQVDVWEFSTGRKRFVFECKIGTSDMAVSSDGSFLATAYSSMDLANSGIRVWDQAAGKILNDLPINNSPVGPCCFSWDAKTLAAVVLPRFDVKQKKLVHEDAGFIVWDVPSGKERLRVRQDYESLLPHIAISPDGNLIAMDGPDYTVCVFDGRTGKELRCFKGHRIWLMLLAFSADGKMLLSTSDDASALIWDIAAIRK
jgi:WD40 repeat protein